MKHLMAAVALLGLAISSAYAHQAPHYRQPAPAISGHGHIGSPHVSGNVVYAEGRAIGQDTEANVRLELLRDKTGTP